MCLWGVQKCFKFGVVWCLTGGVIGRKPQSKNFHQIFRGPRRKNYGSDPKKLGVQKWDGRPLCTCKIRWRSVDSQRQEMKNNDVFCLYVCMYVCQAGYPGKRSGRSTTYNVTVCRAISMRFSLFFTERDEFSNRLQRFQLYH